MYPWLHGSRVQSRRYPFKVGELTFYLGAWTIDFSWCNETQDYWNLWEAFVCVENYGMVGSSFGNSTNFNLPTLGVVESQTFGAAVPSCEADGFSTSGQKLGQAHLLLSWFGKHTIYRSILPGKPCFFLSMFIHIFRCEFGPWYPFFNMTWMCAVNQ